MRCDVGPDIDTFFRIYSESVRNLGTPVLPKRFYAAIVKEFGPAVEIATIHGPGGPVSSMMTYYFKNLRSALLQRREFQPRASFTPSISELLAALIGRALCERGCTTYSISAAAKRGTGAFDYKTY